MSALTIPSTGGRILINHPTYIVHTTVAHDANTFRLLYDQVCVAAYDNSDEVDPMKCYPGTRTLLLERLENWLAAQGNAERLITWLDGPMGSGKTAVARTMAERASTNKKLVGMFMFRRGQPGRSDATRFVATLAYQMALSIPLVRQYIEDQLKHDPSVLQQSLSRQLDALILEPLRRMRSQVRDIDITTLPNLVIVDGLDECGADEGLGKEDMQTRVLDLLHRLVLSQDILPFSILIHSRPENHIKNWFTREPHESMTNRLTLDASYRPDDDIRLFVTETFLKILRDHPNRHLLPPNWPYVVQDPRDPGKPVDAIAMLVNRSSDQFIYAATAMVYIASQHHRPDKRLVSLLFFAHDAEARAPNAPTAIIDALYAQVLNSTDDHEMVKRVLAFHDLFLRPPRNIPYSRLLSIISISIQDMHHCLQQLESLLTFTLTPPLKFHHSSFREFLEDPLRSGSWFLNRDHYYSHFMLCALGVFHDESYVGAQTSCLRLLDFLRSRYPFRTISIYFQREVEQFSDFPNSSYRASVERFLFKVSLSSFIQLTLWVRDVHSGDMFLRHLAALIKPHIQPYLEHPDSFARFLCWASYLPGSTLTNYGRDNASANHRWPGDLRHIVLVLTVKSEKGTSLVFDNRTFATLLSIPSMNFLHDALLTVLKTVEPGLRHSSRWKPPREQETRWWKRVRDKEILGQIIRGTGTPLSIWIYALDCEQMLPDDFRTHIRAFLNMSNTDFNARNIFKELYNPRQPSHDSIVMSPLDFAVGECTRNLEPFQPQSGLYPFLRKESYRQILIPSIPELAVYMAYDSSNHDDDAPPIPVKATLCPCGWIGFSFDKDDQIKLFI